MTFKELEIIEPILKALRTEGYTHPTPIQEQSIPILLDGKDLLGCAQTGTGKTAAFAIPILQNLYLNRQHNNGQRKIKSLIVTPTRELAIQIGDSFTTYGKFTSIKNTVIFGGVKQGSQTNALRKGVDVLVATPGRLLDLMEQGFVSLKHVEFLVLDEADRMLDMGFIHDIRKIIAKLPSKRQSLFFSATMPPPILDLSRKILGNPEKVSVKPEQTTAENVEQAVYFVHKRAKQKLLLHLLQTEPIDSALVFSRTKHGANKIAKMLGKAGINADSIHGNKTQFQRQRALGKFKKGHTNVLVATDIAARGIDIEDLSHVINYDLPNMPEMYVHRIGRTGRASSSGIALSFCDSEEKAYLRDIQKLIDQKIPVVEEHPFLHDNVDTASKDSGNPQRSQKKSWSSKRRNGGGGNRHHRHSKSFSRKKASRKTI